jgi:hypothetical protein
LGYSGVVLEQFRAVLGSLWGRLEDVWGRFMLFWAVLRMF